MSLVFQDVNKLVGRETYLKDIDLDLAPGTRNVILGHTLAGKTTLLRLMAGLERPSRGRILVNGQDVNGVSVRKRSVAMVYQQFINYPSLTVYNNIASPLRMAGFKRAEIDRRVRETAAMLRITDLLGRLPSELSGGQQQRTAIARALVKETDLLLLDEPLVNLDYKLREELRVELQQIFERRPAIVVYTTTEPVEALMMGGNVVVMDEGRILQTGATFEVYRRPATMRVAEIFSDPPINFIDGKVAGRQALIGDGLQIPLIGHMAHLASGSYKFGVRCGHLGLEPFQPDDIVFDAAVELCEINGPETFIHIRHDSRQLVMQAAGVHQIKIGRKISVYVNAQHFFVYDAEGRLAASPFNGRSM